MHLRCPHCQSPIELADLPSGGEITCAGCGSSFHLASMLSTAACDKAVGKRLGKFEILGTVGHGAFGTVVKAHDTELDRIVAIKIPRAGNIGPDPQDLDRFLREARSVAQLRFPSIITIHEVGADNGTPYLVCDFVEGITLADLLTGRRPTFHESAKLLAEVADALQYAHSLGVVHRDIKPSNIMIRPDGSPCVMDFGLAKRDAGEITMTIDGQILGTPAYMSPEQARGEGHKVDGRSDVYSLGVILYQLLTGELPFRGNKSMLLHQVLHEEPRSPRTLNDKIPRDLETIALKAMAKEPHRRYASAKEMAADMRRWLAGEPILARPVRTLERAWRWCKRKPALATASVSGVTGTLLALITFASAYFVVGASLHEEHKQRIKAEGLAGANKLLAEKETRARLDAEVQREQAAKLNLQVQFEHVFFKHKDDAGVAMVGAARLLPMASGLKDRTLHDSICLHLGGWRQETWALNGIFASQGSVVAMAFSPDGKRVLTGGSHRSAELWELASGKLLRSLEHDAAVEAVAFSPNGERVLTGSTDKTAKAWDAATGDQIAVLPHRAPVLAVAFHPDGESVLTWSKDQTAQLWHAATEQTIASIKNVNAAVFSPDGKLVLTANVDKTAKLWDAATGTPIASFPHDGPVVAAAFSANGKFIVTADDRAHVAQIWEVATGKRIAIMGHREITSVAFSPDGKQVLTRGADQTARLWIAATGARVAAISHVTAAAFSPDSKTVLAGSFANAQLLDASNGLPIAAPLHHAMTVSAVAFSPDGKSVLTGSLDMTARCWESVAEITPITASVAGPLRSRGSAVSPDGNVLVSGTGGRSAQLWDWKNGKPIATLKHQDKVEAVAFNAKSNQVLTGCWDKTARLWEVASGKPLASLYHQARVTAVAFSPDGNYALTGTRTGIVQMWDLATGKPAGVSIQQMGEITDLAFSSDGMRILIVRQSTAQVCVADTGRPIGLPIQLSEVVGAVDFGLDGNSLITLERAPSVFDSGGCGIRGPSVSIVRSWKLPRIRDDNPQRILLWTQVNTGMEMNEHGKVRLLDAATWHERRARLEKLGGPPVE